MSHLVLAVAYIGLIALTSTTTDAQVEWTGKPWLGKWEFVREDNWQAFVEAIGSQYSTGGNFKGLELWKDGDNFHQRMTFGDNGEGNEMHFKLGEAFTVTRDDGMDLYKRTFTEDGDKLTRVVKMLAKSRFIEIRDTFEVTGDEMLKNYTIGDVIAKIWLKRLPNPTPAPSGAAA